MHERIFEMNKFKIGDRVESKYEPAGKVGTVIGFAKDMVLVEYDEPVKYGHDGNAAEKHGRVGKNGHCYYSYESELNFAETQNSAPNFTLIIRPDAHNPDITTATLKIGKETVRTESVKRYCKDVYDRETAVKAVMEKMIKGAEKPKAESVREVKREAKQGEWIKATVTSRLNDYDLPCKPRYREGDIMQCTKTHSNRPWKDTAVTFNNGNFVIRNTDYVVLENYRPESDCKVAEPVKAEPKPIEIEGIELKIGSKFIIKKRSDVSTTDGILDSNWDKLHQKVLTVESIRHRDGIPEPIIDMFSIEGFESSYWFRISAIDRIIED